MWPALLTGLTSLAGTGISLSQQSKENEKTRQYNLQLAKMQNEENFKNWQSQNVYNDPSAQINRLRNAGINPDLFYGNGQMSNIAGNIHPSSSGAPANPIDWSSLRTIGQAVRESLAVQRERAEIRKIESETKISDVNADILTKYGLDSAYLNNEKLREELNLLANEAEGIDYSNSLKKVEHDFVSAFRSDVISNMLQRLKSSTQMSENALKEDLETLTLRIAGVNAENSKLVRMSNFTTSEWRLVFDVVRELLSFLK